MDTMDLRFILLIWLLIGFVGNIINYSLNPKGYEITLGIILYIIITSPILIPITILYFISAKVLSYVVWIK